MKNKKILLLLMIGILILGFLFVFFGLVLFQFQEKSPDLEPFNENIYNENLAYEKSIQMDSYLFSSYPISDISHLPSSKQTEFVLNMICDYENDSSLDEVEKKGKEYFSSFELYQGDIVNSDGLLLYSFQNNSFHYENSDIKPYYFVTFDSEKNTQGDVLVIQKKYYYYTFNPLNNINQITIYRSVSDILNNNPVKKFETKNLMIPEEELEEISSSLGVLTYTFKIDNQMVVPIRVQ